MNEEVAEALIAWMDHADAEHFEAVGDEEITDQGRWNVSYNQVYRDKRDESYWSVSWSRGATEYQDNGPENIAFQRVWPRTVMTTIYTSDPPAAEV